MSNKKGKKKNDSLVNSIRKTSRIVSLVSSSANNIESLDEENQDNRLKSVSKILMDPVGFCDYIIEVQDTEFHVHRAFLAKFSEYFQTVFECENDNSYLHRYRLTDQFPQVKPSLFHLFLQVLYSSLELNNPFVQLPLVYTDAFPEVTLDESSSFAIQYPRKDLPNHNDDNFLGDANSTKEYLKLDWDNVNNWKELIVLIQYFNCFVFKRVMELYFSNCLGELAVAMASVRLQDVFRTDIDQKILKTRYRMALSEALLELIGPHLSVNNPSVTIIADPVQMGVALFVSNH